MSDLRIGLKACPLCCDENVSSGQTGKNKWRVGCHGCQLYIDGKVLVSSLEWLKGKLEEKWNDRQLYGDVVRNRTDGV